MYHIGKALSSFFRNFFIFFQRYFIIIYNKLRNGSAFSRQTKARVIKTRAEILFFRILMQLANAKDYNSLSARKRETRKTLYIFSGCGEASKTSLPQRSGREHTHKPRGDLFRKYPSGKEELSFMQSGYSVTARAVGNAPTHVGMSECKQLTQYYAAYTTPSPEFNINSGARRSK